MDIRSCISGLFLTAVIAFVSGPVKANEEEEALARQLFEITNADQTQQAMTEPLIEAVSTQILKDVKSRLSGRGIELDDDQAGALKAFVGERYRVLMAEATVQAKERMVAQYIETFTKDELVELTEAYQRPAVQRMMLLNPGWVAELTQLGEQYARENINRVLYDPLKEWLDSNISVE